VYDPTAVLAVTEMVASPVPETKVRVIAPVGGYPVAEQDKVEPPRIVVKTVKIAPFVAE
jgi:hypothetical protein